MLHSAHAPDNPALVGIPTRLLPVQLRRPSQPASCAELEAATERVRLWHRFLAAFEAMLEIADGGVPLEDFAVVYAMYRQLRRRGVAFDSRFIGFMEQLNREGRGCDDDPDHDDADLRLAEHELSCDEHHEAEGARQEQAVGGHDDLVCWSGGEDDDLGCMESGVDDHFELEGERDQIVDERDHFSPEILAERRRLPRERLGRSLSREPMNVAGVTAHQLARRNKYVCLDPSHPNWGTNR